jgi:hypothetical protein
VADDPIVPLLPTTQSTTTVTTTAAGPDAVEKQTILKGLIGLAVLLVLILGTIGGFSLYLQMMPDPREPGSGVGALRENVMAILSMIMGALIGALKIKVPGP